MDEAPVQRDRRVWTYEPLILSILGVVLLWYMGLSTSWSRGPRAFDAGWVMYAVEIGVGFGMTVPAARLTRGWWRFWAAVLLGVSVGMVGLFFVFWGRIALE